MFVNFTSKLFRIILNKKYLIFTISKNYSPTQKRNFITQFPKRKNPKKRNDWDNSSRIKCKEMILTSKVYENLLFVGTNKGNLLTYDLQTLKVAWGFGCMQKGGLAYIDFCEETRSLIAAGDDPTSLLLKF